MAFNSLRFAAAFFLAVYILYAVFDPRRRVLLLLAASCVFYCSGDWRFLPLVFISLTTDYLCARRMERAKGRVRRAYLIVSLTVDLSILVFFKCLGFFSTGFLLPLGISFYTFRTLSYTIDVYTGRMRACRDYAEYALFVTFFPLLIAGPIARAKDLLPQIHAPRRPAPGGFYEGTFLVFWGFFQKFFVADNLAVIAAAVFNAPPPYDGARIMTGLYAFAFQIYCDFAGYSNIARGVCKWLGFEIPVNFNFPYFTSCAREFWRRWHISLSTWLRDYVYIPVRFLGRRGWDRSGRWALAVTFVLCGLWHGATGLFIAWGLYHAALFLVLTSGADERPAVRWLKAVLFFHLVCFGWLFFAAQSFGHLLLILQGFTRFHLSASGIGTLVPYLWLLLVIETVQFRKKSFPLPSRTIQGSAAARVKIAAVYIR
jgi:D-alanyl-lipoteichoic acid acyltransferase DltB (MBOAT superfamily)